MRIARRAGMSKAKVGLARRLAVIVHRMLALQRCSSLTRGAQQFGQVTTSGLLEAKSLRRDDGSRWAVRFAVT
jgi:hypothetical protein